jgi:glycosyltransferase involved in cell wall biosynthesis
MKILFTGSYKDGNSGWSKAGQLYLRALNTTGVDIVSRAYKLNDSEPNLHPEVQALEEKSLDGVTHVVHCGLPHHYQYNSDFRTVGIFFTETRDYRTTPWPRHINMLDVGIVPCLYAHEAALNSGVKTDIKTVPVPVDLEHYENPGKIDSIEGLGEDYTFLFIGSADLRKGLPHLVRAFHMAFTPNMPVQLVIKTNKWGVGPDQLRQEVIGTLENIKQGLRLRRHYKKEVILTDELDDNQMLALHNSCDCLVAPSLGECWGQTVIDHMALGKPVLTSNTGGFQDYVPPQQRMLSYPAQCYGISDTFETMMTSFEDWEQIDLRSLAAGMSAVVNEKIRTIPKNRKVVEGFALDKVGPKLLEAIK